MNSFSIPKPPEHVIRAFGASGEPVPAGRAWDYGWRYEGLVLSPVTDSAQALWSAKVRTAVEIDGVGFSKSVRTSDGRLVLAGWQARHFVEGAISARADETLVAAQRIDAALAELAKPSFLAERVGDIFTACDNAAWTDDPISVLEKMLDPNSIPRSDCAEALTVAGGLLQLRSDLEGSSARLQVGHSDVHGTLLYDGSNAPVLTDVIPSWHFSGWSTAVAAVDALSMAGADEELLTRFDHIPMWRQLLVRAMCYRLFIHAVHPDSLPGAYRGLSRAASLVKAQLARNE